MTSMSSDLHSKGHCEKQVSICKFWILYNSFICIFQLKTDDSVNSFHYI